jgi:DNA-binding response OmpR family regulator
MGKMALSNLKNMIRIHLILTDLVLPDYIGESLISLFKRLAPEKPVVAMTGWDYNYEKTEPKLNADLLLIKPFEVEELDHAIK